MKYLGQYIQHFISRFRNDVFLENVSSGTIASGGNLGLDSNNKIVKADVPADGDITGISFRPDDTNTVSFTSGAADFILAGGNGIITSGDSSTTLTLAVDFADNEEATFGAANDLRIFHNGSHTYLSNQTGDFYIRNQADDKDIIFQADDGSGGNETYFFLDGSLGSDPFTIFPDSSTLALGTGYDLRLYHDGSNSYIRNTTGNLIIQAATTDGDLILQSDDGSGGETEYLRLDGSTTHAYFSNPGNVGIGTTSPTEKLHVSGNAIITGDLTISGTTTTINTANLNVEDKNITLNYSASDSSSSADGAGITIQDAVDASNDATILWTAASDTFTFSHPINSTLATAAQPNITSLGTLTALQVDNINLDGSTITNSSGDLTIVNTADDADVIFQTDDGSGGVAEYFRLNGGYTSPFTVFPDNSTLCIGAGLDLRFLHNGSNSFIDQTGTGDLYIRQKNNDKDIIFQSDDGSGGVETYFRLDGSTGYTQFLDSKQLAFGSDNDMRIYSSGSTNFVISDVGDLSIQQKANDKDIIFKNDDGSGGTTEYFRLDGGLGYSVASKTIRFDDNVKAALGSGLDLQLYHNGSHSYIENNVGNLAITNKTDDGDIIFSSDDGSGGTTEYFRVDGGTEEIIVSKKMQFGDNVKVVFGAGEDLDIFHDGTDSTINNAVGNLIISNDADDGDIVFKSDNGSGGLSEYFRVDGGSEKTIYTKPISLLDSVGLQLGTGTDAQIYHTGSEGTFINYTGNFRFIQSADNADLSFFSDDGSGGTTEYFKVDGSDERTLFSKKVKIDHDVSDASTSSIALNIDMDVSGSDTLSSDVTQYGIKTELNSTATGGDTSDEHRLVAIQGQSAVDGSSDADTLTGVYGLAKSNRSSSATSSLLRAIQGVAYVTDSAAATSTDIRGGDFSCYVNTDGPDVTSMYGVISNAYTNTNSTDNVSNVSGLYGKAESRGSGTITNANGVYGEIEVDAGTITNGNCFRAVLDHNSGTLTTGYMFRGSATGTIGTTIGVYIDGEDKNYFSNRVGIGTSSPAEKLTLKAASSSEAILGAQYSTTTTNFFEVGVSSHDSYLTLKNSGTTEVIKLNSDGDSYLNGGNVGIGNTSPEAKLDVESEILISGTDPILRMERGDGFNSDIIKVESSTDNIIIGDTSLDEMIFEVDNGEAIRITQDRKVGIGTTSPSDKVEIYADGADVALRIHEDAGTHEAKIHLRRGGADWELINTNDFAIECEGDEKFRIKTTGNVGIGTDSPQKKLDIASGDIRLDNSKSIFFATTDANIGRVSITGDEGSDFIRLKVDNNNSHVLHLNTTGVGIGTTSPGNKLEVNSGTTNVASVFKSSDNQAWISVQDDDSGTYGALFGTDSDEGHHIVLADRSANKRLVIDADGQVGIGATTPTARLHVESVDDAVIRLKSTDNKAYIALSDNDTNGYISSENSKLSLGANVGVNANNFNIDLSNNNVGIGTSSPSNQLHIFNTGNAEAVLERNSGAQILLQAQAAAGVVGTSSNHDLDIKSNGSTRIKVENTGNVGIGTTSPGEKLDVDGDIKLSGDIELGHASDTTIARSAAGKVTIEGAPVQTTQMVVTTHNFQMANTTGTFFYVPFNNLNESSAATSAEYWTRSIAPYAGTIKKVIVRSHTSLGSSCQIRVSKITDTTDDLPSGTHVTNTGIDISTASTSVSTTMSANTFNEGDVVGVALNRSAGSAARVVVTIVWEYTV